MWPTVLCCIIERLIFFEMRESRVDLRGATITESRWNYQSYESISFTLSPSLRAFFFLFFFVPLSTPLVL